MIIRKGLEMSEYKDRFILTTEHPSSSYNQAVLVDTETGQAYGVADVLPDGSPAAGLYERLKVEGA